MFAFTPQREQKTHMNHESLMSLYSIYFLLLLVSSTLSAHVLEGEETVNSPKNETKQTKVNKQKSTNKQKQRGWSIQ